MKHLRILPAAFRRPFFSQGSCPACASGWRRRWSHRWRYFLRFLWFCALGSTVPLQAESPREIYVFGDSAVDTGNYHALPGYAPAANAPYWKGPDGFVRLSNGMMWPERLYPGLQLVSDPKLNGNQVNFAYGGAKTDANGSGLNEDLLLPIGVQTQLDRFEALVAAGRLRPSARSYAFIEAGPNDFFETLGNGGDPVETGAQVAANLAKAAERLAHAGVRTVFVHDIPDFGEAPLFYGPDGSSPNAVAVRQALRGVTVTARAQLRAALESTKQRLGTGVNVVTMPINDLFTAVRTHPQAFGFTNVTGAIYDETNDVMLVRDATQQAGYLFVDAVHLTTQAQRWESRYYAQVIDAVAGGPQQRMARLADGAFAGTDLLRSGAQAGGLNRGVPPTARWTPFVFVGGNTLGAETVAAEAGWRFDTFGALVGLERAFTDRFSAGLAMGAFTQNGRVAGDALHLDTNGGGTWLFGRWLVKTVTVRGSLGYAGLRAKTRRDPAIPTMLARGTANGEVWEVYLETERGLWQGEIEGSLTLGASCKRVTIEGFSENGAPGLNLRYGKFTRDLGVNFGGLRLRTTGLRFGSVRVEPTLDLNLDYETGDRETGVTAALIDNTANPTTGRAAQGSRFRGVVRPGIALVFAPAGRLEFSGSFERGQNEFRRQDLTVTWHMQF